MTVRTKAELIIMKRSFDVKTIFRQVTVYFNGRCEILEKTDYESVFFELNLKKFDVVNFY